MITDQQLDKVEQYAKKIRKLRAVLGDQTTPIQLVSRKRGQQRVAFKRRKEEIRRLELVYEKYLKEITTG